MVLLVLYIKMAHFIIFIYLSILLQMLDLLTVFLVELGSAGESAAEFLSLYQSLVQQSPWKQYLAVKGVLMFLADLLTREIQELHRLEETTLTSDLSQGTWFIFLTIEISALNVLCVAKYLIYSVKISTIIT